MRPTGEVTQALLHAAGALASPGRGGTLREITELACVGRAVAGYTIPKLAARGHLDVVCERRVDYRSRPVFEYAPAGQDLKQIQSQRAGLVPAAAEPRPEPLHNTHGRERETPDTPTTWTTFV
jgi:hypothetical protein